MTLTCTFYLPKDTKKSKEFYKSECVCTLSVYIYEGPVEDNHLIGESSESRRLSEDERKSSMLCMTVHQVASQVDIIFSERCPNKIFIRVVAEIKFTNGN